MAEKIAAKTQDKFAVIKTGGKQYLVQQGDKLKIEKLDVEVGDKVELESLLVGQGDKVELGQPNLNVKVLAKVLRKGRSRKVTGIKYKPKTRQAKSYGHRQSFIEVEIEKI